MNEPDPILLNDRGFSMVEIAMGLGLLGLITLGSMKMLQGIRGQQTGMAQGTEMYGLAKLVESKLLTQNGCELIRGKTLNSPLSAERITVTLPGASQILLDSMVISEFIQATTDDPSGIARITLNLRRKDSGKTSRQDVFMPVSIVGTGGDRRVENCDLSYIRAFETIKNKVCGGTFGIQTAGRSCSEAILLVKNLAMYQVCRDLYGAGRTPTMNGAQCNFRLIHAGKNCAVGTLKGFDEEGRAVCNPP